MTEYLFVYGTLKRGHQLKEGNNLLKGSNFIGFGKINGNLFNLGAYPGLIISKSDDSWVFGEVFELRNPAKTFRIIDQYEGDDYVRVLEEVFVKDEILTCWVYMFIGNTSGLKKIEGGNY